MEIIFSAYLGDQVVIDRTSTTTAFGPRSDHGIRHNPVNLIIGNNLEGPDPLFVDPTNHDFYLNSDSPAVDGASSSGIPANDFDGVARSLGEWVRYRGL